MDNKHDKNNILTHQWCALIELKGNVGCKMQQRKEGTALQRKHLINHSIRSPYIWIQKRKNNFKIADVAGELSHTLLFHSAHFLSTFPRK